MISYKKRKQFSSLGKIILLNLIFFANFANSLSANNKLTKSINGSKAIDKRVNKIKKQPPIRHVTQAATKLTAYAIHDFGEVKEGKSPRYGFEFVNTTEENIKILSTRVPCGCADITIKEKILKPGEKTIFSVKLKSDKHGGKISKNFYLFTDSKKLPIIKYTVKATIIKKPSSACITTPMIKLKSLKPKELIEEKFIIKNEGNLDLTINIRRIPKLIKLKTSLPMTISPGNKKYIEFTLTAPEKLGKLYTKLVLETNDNRRHFVLVMIKGEVK